MNALVRRDDFQPANDILPPRSAAAHGGAMLVHVVNPMVPQVGARRFLHCEGLTVTEAIALAGWKLSSSTVLMRDGELVKRAQWDDRLIAADELVVLVTLPQGGGKGGASQVMAVVAMIALAIVAPQISAALLGAELAGTAIIGGLTYGSLLTVGIVMAGSTLISALLPKPKAAISDTRSGLVGGGSGPVQSPTYTLSAQGNFARLQGVIPERFGRMKFLPDLSDKPYFDFVNSEQQLKQEFCIGIGHFQIEELGVADTPFWTLAGGATGNHSEIEFLIMGPGEPNTLFSTNVETSDDVSNIELIGTDQPGHDWSGPFALCPPGSVVTRGEWDVSTPAGLYSVSDAGNLQSATASFEVQVRVINDAGTALGSWTSVVTKSLNMSTRDATRTTYGVDLSSARYEARFKRTNTKSSDVRVSDALYMLAMRGFLPPSPPPPDTTRVAIIARSTANLNGDSAQQFYCIATRKLPIWNQDTLSWSALTATRRISAAAAYLCMSHNGLRKTASQVDLAKLDYLEDIWTDRGDTFDGTFDTGDSAWQMLIALLRVGRAEPLRIGRWITFNRDHVKTAYSGSFNPTNMMKQSFSADYIMFDKSTADAAWVLYYDERNWKPNKVYCALPDSVMDPDDAPVIDFSLGIVDRDHAWREGMFMVGCNRWRRRFPTFRTELEGRACFRGSKVLVSHWMMNWGVSGQVHTLEEYGDGDVLTLSEPWDQREVLDNAQKRIQLITPDGHVYGPLVVTLLDSGSITKFARVKLVGTFNLTLGKYAGQHPRDWNVWDGDGLDLERPRAIWGTATVKSRDAILLTMKPDNKGATVTCVIDDPRVHYVDGTIPPIEGPTPAPPLEGDAPTTAAPENLVITGISANEVPQVGGVITSPMMTFVVRGAPSAASFDARWKWNSATDWSPVKKHLDRTFSIPAIGGSIILEMRAVGRAAVGDWFGVTASAVGIPPVPVGGGSSGIPNPIAVYDGTTWLSGSQDGTWSWTTDAAALHYIVLTQYAMTPGAWKDLSTENVAADAGNIYSVTNALTVLEPYPYSNPPSYVRIGVKPVYAEGAATSFNFP